MRIKTLIVCLVCMLNSPSCSMMTETIYNVTSGPSLHALAWNTKEFGEIQPYPTDTGNFSVINKRRSNFSKESADLFINEISHTTTRNQGTSEIVAQSQSILSTSLKDQHIRTSSTLLKGVSYGNIRKFDDFQFILGHFEKELQTKAQSQGIIVPEMCSPLLNLWYEAFSYVSPGVRPEFMVDRHVWEQKMHYCWPGQNLAEHLAAEHFLPRNLWDDREPGKPLSNAETFFKLALCARWNNPLAMQKLAEELLLIFDQDPVNEEDRHIMKDKASFLSLSDRLIQQSNKIFKQVISIEKNSPYLRALSHKFIKDGLSLKKRKANMLVELEKGVVSQNITESLLCRFEKARNIPGQKKFEEFRSIANILDRKPEDLDGTIITKLALSWVELAQKAENPQASFNFYVRAGNEGALFGFTKAAEMLWGGFTPQESTETFDSYCEKAAEAGFLNGYRGGAEFFWQDYQTTQSPESYNHAKTYYQKLGEYGDPEGAINYAHLLDKEGRKAEALSLYLAHGDVYHAISLTPVEDQTALYQAYVARQMNFFKEIKGVFHAGI